jgi:fermentation-respiration switch protein FrsA (DUF1100 family)
MRALKSIVVFALVTYAAFVGLLYFTQRGILYPGDSRRTSPADAGLKQASEEILTTADGEKVIVWHVPPKDERPVVIYFHGNGGALANRVRRFAALVADGTGLIALSYRGYGGSTGSPSEDGLINDARAAHAFAAERYPATRLVVWGESLGTGVAVALAAEKDLAKVVLEAPYTSTSDIAAAAYPIVPVRYLMKDQFRSDERVARVLEPVLVIHGERDSVIPIEYGRRLFERIASPKRFVNLPNATHAGLDAHGALAEVKKFIAEK